MARTFEAQGKELGTERCDMEKQNPRKADGVSRRDCAQAVGIPDFR